MIDKSCAKPSKRKRTRRNRRADNPRCNSDSTKSKGFLKVRLRTLKTTDYVTIVKWIFTKYVKEERGSIPLEEHLVLLEVFQILNRRTWVRAVLAKDELSIRFLLVFLLKESSQENGFSPDKNLIKQALLDDYTYFGFYHNAKYPERLFSVSYTFNVSRSERIPKPFVGVGYNDKGYQPPVHESLPYWKELCIHHLYKEDVQSDFPQKREIRVKRRRE